MGLLPVQGDFMEIARLPNKFNCKFFPIRLVNYILNHEKSSLKVKFQYEF